MPWISWTCAAVTFWGVSHLGIRTELFNVNSPGLNMAKQTLYGLFSFFLLLPAVFGPDDRGTIRRLLRSWPIASIGVISYGIYLWHLAWITESLKWIGHQSEAALFVASLLIALALSILSASISYFGMERPLLRWKSGIR